MNKLNLDYFEIGELEPVVVMLHGWGMSKECFKKLVPNINQNQKIIGLDFFGFGASSKPEDYFDTYEYAYSVFVFLKRKNIKSTCLIGHSFGGRICIILSSVFDLNVNGLVLTSSAGINKFDFIKELKILKYKILKSMCKINLVSSNVLKKYGSNDYKNLDDTMKKVFVKVVNQDLKYLLPNINAFANLVWDKSDHETPYYICKTLNKRIKNSHIFLFKTGGHFAFLHNNCKFSKIVNGVINSFKI